MLGQLLCPKCHNIMSRYERNGVHVDSCDGCGGLFLDRGELEHLVQAEASYYAPPAARSAGPVGPPAGYVGDTGGWDGRDGSGNRGGWGDRDSWDRQRPSRKRKARGFLEDLLDL